MADDCQKHRSTSWRESHPELEALMRRLRECQAGAGRHKCAYCAYEIGFVHGNRQAASSPVPAQPSFLPRRGLPPETLDCGKHDADWRERNRRIEDLMDKLPGGQGGAGRDKCSYCAFEHGIERGRQLERDRLIRLLFEPDSDSSLDSPSAQ